MDLLEKKKKKSTLIQTRYGMKKIVNAASKNEINQLAFNKNPLMFKFP